MPLGSPCLCPAEKLQKGSAAKSPKASYRYLETPGSQHNINVVLVPCQEDLENVAGKKYYKLLIKSYLTDESVTLQIPGGLLIRFNSRKFVAKPTPY